jgi:hypothetical protein
MARKQFEVSKRALIGKCSAALLLGSIASIWIVISLSYLSTLKEQGYYSAPVPVLIMHMYCIPIFIYQFIGYMVSGVIYMGLIKRGWINSAIVAYLGVGISGWIISTALLFVYSGFYSLDSIMGASEIGLPSLLLYLWFLYPKPAELNTKESN